MIVARSHREIVILTDELQSVIEAVRNGTADMGDVEAIMVQLRHLDADSRLAGLLLGLLSPWLPQLADVPDGAPRSLELNCGTGDGGFQSGNSCAEGGGGGSSTPSKRKSKPKPKAAKKAAKPKVKKAASPRHPKEKAISDRAARARASHNPSTKAKQDVSEQLETEVTEALGGVKSGDNLPMDVTDQSGRIGLEVKMMHDAKEHRVNMRRDSRQRKEAWVAEKRGRKAYTVLVDNRDTFDGGRHKKKFSGHRYYWKEGVGAFGLGTMNKANDLDEIREALGL